MVFVKLFIHLHDFCQNLNTSCIPAEDTNRNRVVFKKHSILIYIALLNISLLVFKDVRAFSRGGPPPLPATVGVPGAGLIPSIDSSRIAPYPGM